MPTLPEGVEVGTMRPQALGLQGEAAEGEEDEHCQAAHLQGQRQHAAASAAPAPQVLLPAQMAEGGGASSFATSLAVIAVDSCTRGFGPPSDGDALAAGPGSAALSDTFSAYAAGLSEALSLLPGPNSGGRDAAGRGSRRRRSMWVQRRSTGSCSGSGTAASSLQGLHEFSGEVEGPSGHLQAAAAAAGASSYSHSSSARRSAAGILHSVVAPGLPGRPALKRSSMPSASALALAATLGRALKEEADGDSTGDRRSSTGDGVVGFSRMVRQDSPRDDGAAVEAAIAAGAGTAAAIPAADEVADTNSYDSYDTEEDDTEPGGAVGKGGASGADAAGSQGFTKSAAGGIAGPKDAAAGGRGAAAAAASHAATAAVDRYGSLLVGSAGWRYTEMHDVHDTLLMSRLTSNSRWRGPQALGSVASGHNANRSEGGAEVHSTRGGSNSKWLSPAGPSAPLGAALGQPHHSYQQVNHTSRQRRPAAMVDSHASHEVDLGLVDLAPLSSAQHSPGLSPNPSITSYRLHQLLQPGVEMSPTGTAPTSANTDAIIALATGPGGGDAAAPAGPADAAAEAWAAWYRAVPSTRHTTSTQHYILEPPHTLSPRTSLGSGGMAPSPAATAALPTNTVPGAGSGARPNSDAGGTSPAPPASGIVARPPPHHPRPTTGTWLGGGHVAGSNTWRPPAAGGGMVAAAAAGGRPGSGNRSRMAASTLGPGQAPAAVSVPQQPHQRQHDHTHGYPPPHPLHPDPQGQQGQHQLPTSASALNSAHGGGRAMALVTCPSPPVPSPRVSVAGRSSRMLSAGFKLLAGGRSQRSFKERTTPVPSPLVHAAARGQHRSSAGGGGPAGASRVLAVVTGAPPGSRSRAVSAAGAMPLAASSPVISSGSEAAAGTAPAAAPSPRAQPAAERPSRPAATHGGSIGGRSRGADSFTFGVPRPPPPPMGRWSMDDGWQRVRSPDAVMAVGDAAATAPPLAHRRLQRPYHFYSDGHVNLLSAHDASVPRGAVAVAPVDQPTAVMPAPTAALAMAAGRAVRLLPTLLCEVREEDSESAGDPASSRRGTDVGLLGDAVGSSSGAAGLAAAGSARALGAAGCSADGGGGGNGDSAAGDSGDGSAQHPQQPARSRLAKLFGLKRSASGGGAGSTGVVSTGSWTGLSGVGSVDEGLASAPASPSGGGRGGLVRALTRSRLASLAAGGGPGQQGRPDSQPSSAGDSAAAALAADSSAAAPAGASLGAGQRSASGLKTFMHSLWSSKAATQRKSSKRAAAGAAAGLDVALGAGPSATHAPGVGGGAAVPGYPHGSGMQVATASANAAAAHSTSHSRVRAQALAHAHAQAQAEAQARMNQLAPLAAALFTPGK
eukprot:XP_001699665.1 predicted protein [Chlamydomonas reinhardtii]